ncbi:Crp/Fnr family transcriptional regulator [Oceaniglobus indicus]|uniref:Crp/Fnr family transcriptional regulator n=1 Tax=Oceaniglobus indicus TaxID=2047749 RepID=UPI000C1967D5|nr:Crp/Fnr family transcriptional regulator [Oceaniglobus indicus]
MNTNTPDHPCGGCAFYDDSVWRPVDACGLSDLKRGFSRNSLAAQQVLYAQDDENRGVFCVSAGLIAVRTHHRDGTSTLIKLAYPGDVIGYRSFLSNARHKTEARALVPSRVCAVAPRNVARIIDANPGVLHGITARCLTEIDGNHDRIIAASVSSNRDRLRNLLMQLMQRHGQREGDRLCMHLPLSRSDLADLIGVRPETMSRLLRQLKEDGTLTVSGREIAMVTAPTGQPPETQATPLPPHRRPANRPATTRSGADRMPAPPDRHPATTSDR